MNNFFEQPVRSPRVRTLIGFSVFMMLSFIIAATYQASKSYHESLQTAKRSAEQLVHIIGDHVELSLLGVDLSLRRTIERQYINSVFGNNLPEYTEQNFKLWLAETPQIAAIALIGDNGAVEVAAHKKGYEDWLDYDKSLADKSLFEQLRAAEGSVLYIGRHQTQSGKPLMLMGRRYNSMDNEFGGIVLAAINPNYFVDFYKSVASGSYKYMTIMTTSGTQLASGPVKSEENEALAEQLLATDVKEKQRIYSFNVKKEQYSHLGAIQVLRNMPVAVAVILDERDFLNDWHESRMKDIVFVVLFTIFGSILSFFAVTMAKQIVRVQESEGSAILASQAKSEFLANMSHELRTPLNAIIGFSEMINSGYFGPLNAKQKERIHDIHLCGSHLLQLITDILEFSKGEAGKLELVEEKVNLGDLIDEAIRIMNGKVKSKHISLVVAVDPDLALLWGDKRKIRQVLLNLLSNAVKFTPENGMITVSAKMDIMHNITISVTDTGIGISEDDIPRALSVFGQVNRTKSHEGTGLGLPLCKMYAELHDGKLILTSRVGEGTSVRVIFPQQRALIEKAE